MEKSHKTQRSTQRLSLKRQMVKRTKVDDEKTVFMGCSRNNKEEQPDDVVLFQPALLSRIL